ncbi:DUF1822 family protein [Calothrix sp. UHCC 0171]|uniref:DUF1822 family protein n=1 Tax=Calothrix sp. UHCC 0171 TaxID=3110245 RepID=UPI002B1F4C07|nr:DUF1822 family protein [Calothrix sp. UHCC 0171]MEA5572563.1 DUF1822 family protein [Calothrix sp. UHCC 0171]
MIYQPPPTPDSHDFDLLDWYCFNDTRIELQPADLQQAANLSQSIHQPEQRWQVYLCALGVLGFAQWLQERDSNLIININQASIWQPPHANLVAAACKIQVGNFQVCLVTANKFSNQHSFPFAVFDVPELAAHFYVLMQVDEEQNQVAISGFINYEQYLQYQHSAHPEIESDWTYTLPESIFNQDVDKLLLNLRCLDAEAILLPITATIPTEKVIALQQKLESVKSQLQTKKLWELITPAEAQVLLNNPELINWVYKATTPSIIQPLINVGLWLQNQIDNVAQELGWMLMPSVALSQMRDFSEGFDAIRSTLETKGVYIPLTAGGAFRDLDSECGSLRLYAIMWILDETSDTQEWVLLIALGSQPHTAMPQNIKLEIHDDTQILVSEFFADSSKGIPYGRVIGDVNERFQVTVTIEDAVFEIPPFGMGWE